MTALDELMIRVEEQPPIGEMKSRYQDIAKAVAEGYSDPYIEDVFEMTQGIMPLLRNDPAFQEAVAYWRKDRD